MTSGLTPGWLEVCLRHGHRHDSARWRVNAVGGQLGPGSKSSRRKPRVRTAPRRLEEPQRRAPEAAPAPVALRSRQAGAGPEDRERRAGGCGTETPPGGDPGGERAGHGGLPAEWPGRERAALVLHRGPVCRLPGAGESSGCTPPGWGASLLQGTCPPFPAGLSPSLPACLRLWARQAHQLSLGRYFNH